MQFRRSLTRPCRTRRGPPSRRAEWSACRADPPERLAHGERRHSGHEVCFRACEALSVAANAAVPVNLVRMFRNAGHCFIAVEGRPKPGASLHVLGLGADGIDTTSAAGRFMLVVLAGAAEMERNLTRERTRSAMAVKRANGQRVGSIPYGFDLADDRVTLILNESEQKVIQVIREMRSRGMKLQEIAETLTGRGVPTKTGKSNRWTHQAVARILSRA